MGAAKIPFNNATATFQQLAPPVHLFRIIGTTGELNNRNDSDFANTSKLSTEKRIIGTFIISMMPSEPCHRYILHASIEKKKMKKKDAIGKEKGKTKCAVAHVLKNLYRVSF